MYDINNSISSLIITVNEARALSNNLVYSKIKTSQIDMDVYYYNYMKHE